MACHVWVTPVRLLAVDPGLANTGVVLFDGRHIADAWTLRTKANGARPDFAHSVTRGLSITGDLRDLHEQIGDVDVCVAESFRDIPGHLRDAANRWTTPLLIGLLTPALIDFAPTLVWQDPERVMRAYSQAVRLWELGQHGLVAGDERLRNEHVRSAAAHGLAYLDAQRVNGRAR
jgi:hypothetical protein